MNVDWFSSPLTLVILITKVNLNSTTLNVNLTNKCINQPQYLINTLKLKGMKDHTRGQNKIRSRVELQGDILKFNTTSPFVVIDIARPLDPLL